MNIGASRLLISLFVTIFASRRCLQATDDFVGFSGPVKANKCEG